MPSARRIAWAKFRVTVVSFAAIAILLTLFYLLAGGTLREEKAVLYLYVPDATGLGQGSPVRVDGIGVGQIESVRLTGSNEPSRIVRVVMKVSRARLASIPVDSYAQIGAETMIGDKLVDITSGRSAMHVRPGSTIRFKEEPSAMKSLDLQQFEARLRSVDAVVRDIELGRNRVGEFITGEQMYEDLRRKLRETERGFQAAAETTNSVGRALYTDEAYRRISTPLLELDRTLARIQSGQGEAGRFLRDPAQYEQFRNAVADLRGSIAGFRDSNLVRSDALYTGWVRRVDAVIQTVDEANASPLLLTPATYDNLTGAMRELSGAMREFRRDPKKFLRKNIF
jgi:phospholipid/cholesterol/gamma-HCH transport system substrate-binding protein